MRQSFSVCSDAPGNIISTQEDRELVDRDREQGRAPDPDQHPQHAHGEQRDDQLVRTQRRHEQVPEVARVSVR